jgi:hypothetical protein
MAQATAPILDSTDRARRTIQELDPVEAGIVQVHLQFLHNDIVRHGSEIVETLHRVEKAQESSAS